MEINYPYQAAQPIETGPSLLQQFPSAEVREACRLGSRVGWVISPGLEQVLNSWQSGYLLQNDEQKD